MFATGLAQSAEHLILCRLLTGVGVAGIGSSVVMSLSDLSTPLNRQRTIAPLQTASNAGVAVGPALGGFALTFLSMRHTFFATGAFVSAVGLLNIALVDETKKEERGASLPIRSCNADSQSRC